MTAPKGPEWGQGPGDFNSALQVAMIDSATPGPSLDDSESESGSSPGPGSCVSGSSESTARSRHKALSNSHDGRTPGPGRCGSFKMRHV